MIVHHQFIRTAKREKKKLAIIDRTTGKRVTYSRALIGTFILAKRFKPLEPQYLGIMIPTSAGSMLSAMGAITAGLTPVMINYSTGAADNCRYAQEKCGFKTIITSKALLEKIKCPVVQGMIFIEDIMESVKEGEKIKAALKTLLPFGIIKATLPKSKESDSIVVLFTSGSEKDPKAVPLTHENLGSNIESILEFFSLTDDDRILCILPMFHIFGYNTQFLMPLTTGMTTVTYANPLDFKTIPKVIREEKPTMTAGTPVFLGGYLRESNPGDFDSIKLIVAGADKVPEWMRKGYQEKHKLTLFEGYGATETSPVISSNKPGSNRPGSIGIPLPGVDIMTVNRDGKEAAAGEEGAIHVKGKLVFGGYLHDPQTSGEVLHNGWYDTGDIGVIDADGYLWHKGRARRFVKVGGEMVSLVHIESEMEKWLPSGVEVCVVGIPDEQKGSRLIAVFNGEVDKAALSESLLTVLPAIAVPKQFIVIDELPKMGSGKIAFREVENLAASHKG